MLEVKNLKGLANTACHCNSWLDHWKNYSNSFLIGCAATGCYNDAEVGGHVVFINRQDKNHYIIPICKSCSNLRETYRVRMVTTFVSADMLKTCKE